MISSPSIYVDQLHEHAVKIAMERVRLEALLIGAILADHQTALPETETAGVTQELFAGEDHRLIFLACVVGREFSIGTILRVAFAALRRDGQPWTAEALEALANSHLPSLVAVRSYAGRLIAIDAREREAEAAFRLAVDILAGDVEPAGKRKARPPMIMLAPLKRGAA